MGGSGVITPEDIPHFQQLFEAQGLRSLRRYLDYGKRAKSSQGLGELYHWLGKILLDDGRVYKLEERAMACEIAACERLASQWTQLSGPVPAADLVFVNRPPDRLAIYRHILHADTAPEYSNAWAELLASRYKKHWSWIGDCAKDRSVEASYSASESVRLFDQFLLQLDQQAPLTIMSTGTAPTEEELQRQRDRIEEQEREIEGFKEDLEFAEDRASRAHRRSQALEKEMNQAKRKLSEERENGEKLRQERSRRIKLDRQTTEGEKELEVLRREYVKLDQRLHQMAQRLVEAKSQGSSGAPIDLQALRQLGVEQILGVERPVTEEEIGQLRRQFAAVFHPDRAERLPVWVRTLCEEILGIVNEACDRLR